MGKSSKQETGPSKFSKPYIQAGANALQGAYDANQPNIQNISSFLQNNMGNVAASTLNNPTLGAANTYTQDVLGGKYLGAGNPQLGALIDSTNSDVANKVNASIGTRGGAGGSAQAQILARELAKNETGLRYTDYNNERTNQQQASGNAASLASAGNQGIATLLSYLTGQAQIPQSSANSYAQSLAGLLGNYNTTTQTQSLGSTIAPIIGSGLSAWATGGFKGI